MIDAPRLTIRALRVRAVDVPLARPVQTASGSVDSSSLVLIDILTEQGITGCSYLFAYTPLALVPLARLVANLADALVGRPVAPVSIERDLRNRFRLLGPLGLAGMAIAGVEMAVWDTL